MPKSMRSRTLNRRCQIARADAQGNPLRDEHGNYVLDYEGQWFFHVSGGDHHDRKRVLPVDHEALLQYYAARINDGLKRRGSARTVTAAEVYAELVQRCRRPSETYAPPGRPEEFSLVLNKELCVNWTHGFGPAAAAQPFSLEEMSFFANTLPAEGGGGESPSPDAPEDGSGKRKGKPKGPGLTLKDLGVG